MPATCLGHPFKPYKNTWPEKLSFPTSIVKLKTYGTTSLKPLVDHIGIRCSWKIHLEWLRENIKTVRMMKISEAAWSLADWED